MDSRSTGVLPTAPKNLTPVRNTTGINATSTSSINPASKAGPPDITCRHRDVAIARVRIGLCHRTMNPVGDERERRIGVRPIVRRLVCDYEDRGYDRGRKSLVTDGGCRVRVVSGSRLLDRDLR